MKRLIALLVSVALLTIVWSTLDHAAMIYALADADPGILATALAWLVCLVVLSGLRLLLLATVCGYGLSPVRVIRATLIANTLNMVLPSKLGDVLKAATLAESGSGNISKAFALGVWEKLIDITMLFVVAALGTIAVGGAPELTALLLVLAGVGLSMAFVPGLFAWIAERFGEKGAAFGQAWRVMIASLRSRPFGLAAVTAFSGLIWLGHLLQIALMAHSLGVAGDLAFWGAIIARIPLVIVAGLVPLTLAGIGTRDAVIVVLYAPLFGSAAAAALGILFWLRYLVPGLLGLPLLPSYGNDLHAHLDELRRSARR